MGKIVRNGVEYGGSSNSAETIKYNETKNVKDAINEIKSKAMFIDSFNTDTGTLNTTSASPSSNPTAASVTFNNTDTGLNATNVQDAVTEVNGKLNLISKTYQISATTSEKTVDVSIDGYKAIALKGWSCVQQNVYCTELYLSSDTQLTIRTNGASVVYVVCLYSPV